MEGTVQFLFRQKSTVAFYFQDDDASTGEAHRGDIL
jgi:hypothetical protein